MRIVHVLIDRFDFLLDLIIGVLFGQVIFQPPANGEFHRSPRLLMRPLSDLLTAL